MRPEDGCTYIGGNEMIEFCETRRDTSDSRAMNNRSTSGAMTYNSRKKLLLYALCTLLLRIADQLLEIPEIIFIPSFPGKFPFFPGTNSTVFYGGFTKPSGHPPNFVRGHCRRLRRFRGLTIGARHNTRTLDWW
jgi:hypothetical protein